jgi:GTP-binding protein Era
LFVADTTRKFSEDDRRAIDMARKPGAPIVLVLNKVDLLRDKAALLPLIEQYKAVFEFAEYLPVSAAKGTGLDDLRATILKYMPEGPQYFPEDYVTDQPERFLAAELVREKLLQATRQEVPHSVAVSIDRWEESPEITRIYATIRVEREGQKGIVIGQGAAMLKQIGTQARQEMEKLFGVKVYLDLHVKVEPGWREKRAFLKALDWRTMTGEDDQ